MQISILLAVILLVSTSYATSYCESALDLAHESLLSISDSRDKNNMDSLVNSLFDLAYDVGNINMYCQYTSIEAVKPEMTEHEQSNCAVTLSALDKLIQTINEEKIENVETIGRVLGLMPYLRKNCALNFQMMDVEEDIFALTREQENFEEADSNAEHQEETLQTREE